MEEQRIYGNLTLNLSLPLSLATWSESAHPKHDDASQLVSELASHLSANITGPGSVNTLLKCHINSSLATNDRAVIATAIQILAAEYAHKLVEEFPSVLARQVAISIGSR